MSAVYYHKSEPTHTMNDLTQTVKWKRIVYLEYIGQAQLNDLPDVLDGSSNTLRSIDIMVQWQLCEADYKE